MSGQIRHAAGEASVLAGRSKLIRAVVATPTNVADSTVLPHSAAQRCFQVAESITT